MNEESKEPGAAPEPPEDQVSTDDPYAQLVALGEERDKLAAEKAELNDRLLRRTAEFDNFRKRAERDRAEHAEYAGMETVRALLPVLDDFERALKQPCSDAVYSKGIELIHSRVYEILKKLGLDPIEALGQTFDPNLHQGIEMVNTPDAADQTILAEFQRGYRFKGKLLRPSMVKVAVNNG